MADIIDQFLDVDFTRQPQYVRGFNADDYGRNRSSRAYEDAAELIPESEWKDRIAAIDAAGGGADRLVTRIYDQKNEGSCVANACCQSHEIVQALQFGKDAVTHLSAISVYKKIGRSPGSGAMVSDGLDQMRDVGALPLDDDKNRPKWGTKCFPNTGFYNKYPDGWEEVAKNFRIDEWDEIRSFAGLMTALLNLQPVVVGRQGHSICYCRPMLRNGSYVAKYANSWHESWGDKGFGYDSLSQMKMSSGWAFTPRSIVVPN